MAEYKKAIGEPHGLAELSIFYCEEAFRFVESCSWDDERYFDALIRMYAREPFCVAAALGSWEARHASHGSRRA